MKCHVSNVGDGSHLGPRGGCTVRRVRCSYGARTVPRTVLGPCAARRTAYGKACRVTYHPRGWRLGCVLLHKFDMEVPGSALGRTAKGRQQGRMYLPGRGLGFRRVNEWFSAHVGLVRCFTVFYGILRCRTFFYGAWSVCRPVCRTAFV